MEIIKLLVGIGIGCLFSINEIKDIIKQSKTNKREE